MNRYIAFLRAINVSGQNLIKMKDLNDMFQSAGFEKVKTFIQSGNVLFQSAEHSAGKVAAIIEDRLFTTFGKKIVVIVRTLEEIGDMVKKNPFSARQPDEDTKRYVCFLKSDPAGKPSLPMISEKEGLEVFRIENRNAFIISSRIIGRYGFPNAYIEKRLGIPATSRNWNTVLKMSGYSQ